MGYLDDYMPPSQRKVVTPNNDTIYGAGFADLADEPAVIQTPTDVPEGHYWTIQITDLFTNVIHQLGSASGTPGGKFLLVGPDWNGTEAGRVHRCPAHADQRRRRARRAASPPARRTRRRARVAVLNQIGMFPLSQDTPGR